MNTKQIACTALAFVLGAALMGCSGGEPAPIHVDPLPTATVAPLTPTEEDGGLGRLRKEMEPSAAIAGVFCLGYFDEMAAEDDFFSRLELQEYLEAYPFLREIPLEQRAKNAGGQIYCVVPADPNAVVTVTAWDDLNGTAGEVLYQSEDGRPFWLQGNESDSLPNLSVTIQDSYGNLLDRYHPIQSLENGELILPQDPQPVVLNLTFAPQA